MEGETLSLYTTVTGPGDGIVVGENAVLNAYVLEISVSGCALNISSTQRCSIDSSILTGATYALYCTGGNVSGSGNQFILSADAGTIGTYAVYGISPSASGISATVKAATIEQLFNEPDFVAPETPNPDTGLYEYELKAAI